MVYWTDLQLGKQKRRARRKSERADRFNAQWKSRQAWRNIRWSWFFISSEAAKLPELKWNRRSGGFSERYESVMLNRKTRHKIKIALHVQDFDVSKYDLKLPYVD